MIKLTYFDFNFWRIDILRLSLSYGQIPYELNQIKREDWLKEKNKFPFGQLPVMDFNEMLFGHTHSLAIFCATKSNLYDTNDENALIINQVLDWANDITIKIAPSIREKNPDKAKKKREFFIRNDLNTWFVFLQDLLQRTSTNKKFFTDKFSLADITAWRLIYWFKSGKLDQINSNFLDDFTVLKSYFENLSNYKPLNELKEYSEIIS
jgi:glutathione S-transferase